MTGYIEKKLYRTMRQVGITCDRKFEPKFKITGATTEGHTKYIITNEHERYEK